MAGVFGEQGRGQEGVESWEVQQGRVLKARKWSQARHWVWRRVALGEGAWVFGETGTGKRCLGSELGTGGPRG